MAVDLLWMLIRAASGLVCVACLLRAYLQWLRISPLNPLTQLCFRLTNWLVLPMRRVVRPLAGLDTSSLLAACLVSFVAAILKWALFVTDVAPAVDATDAGLPMPLAMLLLALAWVIGWWLRFLVLLVIAHVLMSWFGASPAAEQIRPVLAAMVEPFMGPLRQLIHRGAPSGLDFSPIVVFLLLQVMLTVHERVEHSLSAALLGLPGL